MKCAVLVGLLALVSWSAQAAHSERGWRVGAEASFADFQGDDIPDPNLGSKFIEDDTVGFKVYGQYQLNKWFGVEAAYHKLSDFEDQSKDESVPGKLTLSFDGFSGQALVLFPLLSEDAQGFVKAGYFDFNDDLTVGSSTTSHSSESGLVWGAGALIDVADQFGIRMEYERFDNSVGDLWAVHIGVQYSFGGPPETAAPPPPPPPPPAAGAAVDPPPPADSDGDGVMDDGDDCPGTPAGASVNDKGCEG